MRARGGEDREFREIKEIREVRTIKTIKTIGTIRTIKMVADKFPNGLNGPIGLNPNGLIGPIGPNRHSRSCTLLSTTKFVVRRAPSATLGKNATDG